MKKKSVIQWIAGVAGCLIVLGCGNGSGVDESEVRETEQVFEAGISSQTSAPNTKISKTVRPTNPSHSTSAEFKFSCNTPPCTFKCNLDLAGWKKCKSPKTYTNLGDGEHIFKVRAIANGIQDPTPAKYKWTVQTRDYWIPVSGTNAPSSRRQHTAVWTGTEMIIYGGIGGGDSGSKYDPLTDSWTAISLANLPTYGRYSHTAVWSGTEMIVWGGVAISGGSYLSSGVRYNPSSDSWTQVQITGNTPSGRNSHTAVWSGTEMIIWGGYDGSNPLNNGASYNPSNVGNEWIQLPSSNAPSARYSHTAVWAGDKMIVWGGIGSSPSYKNDGAAYSPSGYNWTTISTTNAPLARANHSAVWTGTEMIIWGGRSPADLNDGAKYNPVSNSWSTISSVNAPSARSEHSAIWTGTRMIIWGGVSFSPTTYYQTGASYDPNTDSWQPTSITDAPSGRKEHSVVWTGDYMIIWGGYDNTILGDGALYVP